MTIAKWLSGIWSRPAITETGQQREYREATERWMQHNAAKRAAGCPCGQPATHVRYHHGNVGAVPVESWTCVDHYGMASWGVDWESGRFVPRWIRRAPCSSCSPGACPTGRRIGAPEPDTWYCLNRPEQLLDEDGRLIAP